MAGEQNISWMCTDAHGDSRMYVTASTYSTITQYISECHSTSTQVLKPGPFASCAPGSSQFYQISKAFIGIICLMAEITIVKQYHIRAFYIKMNILSQLVAVSSQCHTAMTMAGSQPWPSQYCWLYGHAYLKPRSLRSHMCR